MYIWLLHNLVGNKWIYSLSCANIGKDFDIVKEYAIIFKKETYVVEVQAYNEMGETKWTPVTHFTTTNNTIATGLNQVTSDKSQVTSEEWYTLDGRKLNGKPAAKGIYIQNGQKQIIK